MQLGTPIANDAVRPTRAGKLRVALLGGLVVAAYFVAPASVPAGGRSGPLLRSTFERPNSRKLLVPDKDTIEPLGWIYSCSGRRQVLPKQLPHVDEYHSCGVVPSRFR